MKFYFILVFCFLYNLSVFGQISTLNSTDGSILITPRGLKGKTNNGVSLGENALFSNTTGYNNTAIGSNSLYSNTTGNSNTANGLLALRFNTTGNNNTATGESALRSNTTGSENTANGYYSLLSNISGNSNTASGYWSLKNNNGSYNTANGYEALNYNTGGGSNTANGYDALYSNTFGSRNTANGSRALESNTTGNENTAFGSDAGGGIVNGSNNVFLGFSSRASSDMSNAIAIGSGAIVTQSNAIQLGNSSITNVKTSGIISVNGLSINGDPKPSAVVDLSNSSKGFLPPKLNNYLRNSIKSPEIGLTIFNTDSNCLEFYLAEGWYNMCKNQIVAVADIEGNSYGLVSIGTQVWLDQNLNVTKFNNGDSFSEVLTVSEWNTTSNPAWCWYGNTPKSNYLGKLYNWNVVNDARNVCPVGFHIPTDSEWTVLTNFFGGENVAAGPLKQTGTTTWYSPNTGATNASKFSATSNGYRNFEYTIYTDSNNYSALGSYGTWWTKTNFDTLKAYHRYMYWGNVAVNRGYSNKKNGFGIRCLKD